MAKYNSETQKLYISVLLANPHLYTTVKSITKPEYFNDEVRGAIQYIEDYNENYSSLPDNIMVKTKTGIDVPKLEKTDDAIDKWFLDEYPVFCRHKALENAIYASNEKIENGEYDVVEEYIKEASSVRLMTDWGLNYSSNVKERLENILKRTGNMSTGLSSIDETTGKLNLGDLILYSGGPGSGKSLFLQNHAINHWQNGLNVLMITLELHPELCARRMDSMVLGRNTNELYYDLNQTASGIESTQQKTNGSLYVKYMPSNSSTSDIKNFVKLFMTETGTKVDVLIVDYVDIVTPSGKYSVGDTHGKDKLVTEELRNIAQEYQFPLISASQLNRNSVGVDDLDQSHIAGGISKVNTADLLFGIITNNTMKEKGQYYLQVLKSRNSTGTGRKIPIIMNTETMRMYDDPEFLNTINSNMNKSISEANKSLDNTELENTMNEIQDALNKDDQSYTPLGESSTGDSSDDKLGELKSLIDKANRGA